MFNDYDTVLHQRLGIWIGHGDSILSCWTTQARPRCEHTMQARKYFFTKVSEAKVSRFSFSHARSLPYVLVTCCRKVFRSMHPRYLYNINHDTYTVASDTYVALVQPNSVSGGMKTVRAEVTCKIRPLALLSPSESPRLRQLLKHGE